MTNMNPYQSPSGPRCTGTNCARYRSADTCEKAGSYCVPFLLEKIESLEATNGFLKRHSDQLSDELKRRMAEQIPRKHEGKFVLNRDVYTTGQVAAALSVSDRTVRNWLSKKILKAHQHPLTSTWRVERLDLKAFIEKRGGEVHIPQED